MPANSATRDTTDGSPRLPEADKVASDHRSSACDRTGWRGDAESGGDADRDSGTDNGGDADRDSGRDGGGGATGGATPITLGAGAAILGPVLRAASWAGRWGAFGPDITSGSGTVASASAA